MSEQEPELECLTINLVDYRKIKKVKEYLKELDKIKNDLITSAQNIAEHCEKNNDINKIYNELCEAVQVYTKLIDTYRNHLKRLEKSNGI
jgi:uncharacterized coiled-coil DUF342 family protein